jgi:hypothetical protein
MTHHFLGVHPTGEAFSGNATTQEFVFGRDGQFEPNLMQKKCAGRTFLPAPGCKREVARPL